MSRAFWILGLFRPGFLWGIISLFLKHFSNPNALKPQPGRAPFKWHCFPGHRFTLNIWDCAEKKFNVPRSHDCILTQNNDEMCKKCKYCTPSDKSLIWSFLGNFVITFKFVCIAGKIPSLTKSIFCKDDYCKRWQNSVKISHECFSPLDFCNMHYYASNHYVLLCMYQINFHI